MISVKLRCDENITALHYLYFTFENEMHQSSYCQRSGSVNAKTFDLRVKRDTGR